MTSHRIRLRSFGGEAAIGLAYWRNTSKPHDYWQAELVVRNSMDSQSIAVLIGMIISDCELAHEFEQQRSSGN